jgi:hypothetical protein
MLLAGEQVASDNDGTAPETEDGERLVWRRSMWDYN